MTRDERHQPVPQSEAETLAQASLATVRLSVVIAASRSLRETARCLESLGPQCRDIEAKVEVIVCLSGFDAPSGMRRLYPDVVFLAFDGDATLPVLLGKGIRRAGGDIIALTETACSPRADWIAAILQAHQSAHLVIGGAVDTVCRNNLDWAAYFCEYGQFMRPFSEGPAAELAGNNISFKKAALELEPQFAQPAFWKTLWCRELQKKGIALFRTPSVVVSLEKSYRPVPFLWRRFHHGRCFAAMRPVRSPRQRLFYSFGSPLLPLIFGWRLMRQMIPKRHRQWTRSLPWCALAILAWSCGEFCGYLRGAGKSCARVR